MPPSQRSSLITRVFVLDDHPTFLDHLRSFLNDQTAVHIVGSAATLSDCLDQLASLQPHVLILDPPMTDLTEGETIRAVRAQWPRLGIVVLTVHDKGQYEQAALNAGADEFVSKSQVNVDLLPAIRRARAARRGPAGET